jgi:hypothetical protein
MLFVLRGMGKCSDGDCVLHLVLHVYMPGRALVDIYAALVGHRCRPSRCCPNTAGHNCTAQLHRLIQSAAATHIQQPRQVLHIAALAHQHMHELAHAHASATSAPQQYYASWKNGCHSHLVAASDPSHSRPGTADLPHQQQQTQRAMTRPRQTTAGRSLTLCH